MKYKINYFCQNCECSSEKEFKKSTQAPTMIKCDNCGCDATKNGTPAPYQPYEKKPWDDEPKSPWEEPWKLPYRKRDDGPYWSSKPDENRPKVKFRTGPSPYDCSVKRF